MKVVVIAGARPNFMKIAPLIHTMEKYKDIERLIIHTGQHFDEKMSGLFFKELGIPEPEINLSVGAGTQIEQIANIMLKLEQVCRKEKPDIVIVVGDVTSTVACALVASKLQIKLAHVEAGLRSRDKSMPEEDNRIVVDHLSDYLFVTEEAGVKNLLHEGISKDRIYFVGNVMIDTLIENELKIDKIKKREGAYAVLTLHRPSNVDDKNQLRKIVDILEKIQKKVKVVFPIHPRTQKNIEEFGLKDKLMQLNNVELIEPQGYLSFMSLVKHAKFVLTDSGGIQEETSFLNIPCITMRENTERPITITKGTNFLTGTDDNLILETIDTILNEKAKKRGTLELWDGKAAQRIVEVLTHEK